MADKKDEYFILHHRGDEWIVNRASRCEANGQCSTAGHVADLSELDWEPLTVGAAVLELVQRDDEHISFKDAGFGSYGNYSRCLILPLGFIEPPEPKGLAYLKELQGGKFWTVRSFTDKESVFMVTPLGLSWVDGEVWLWDNTISHGDSAESHQSSWHGLSWVQSASSETVEPWKPE